MTILATKDLCYKATRDGMNILNSVNVNLRARRMTAIMGLNGAGKTTLLKLLSGVLTAHSGSVLLEGKFIQDEPARALARQIAYVPQDFPTDFPFTVAEFVLMGRFAWQNHFGHNEMDFDLVRSALKRLHLETFSARLVSSLSGGERQRVLVARALAQDSPVILLDEPTNHMDVKNKRLMLDLLESLKLKEHKTIVAVMHDFEAVRRFFDDVVFLKNGELAFEGEAQGAFTNSRIGEVFEVDGLIL